MYSLYCILSSCMNISVETCDKINVDRDNFVHTPNQWGMALQRNTSLVGWVYAQNDIYADLSEISQLQTISSQNEYYRQISNISRTSVGNTIVDHSDVVAASPFGAAPTTSSFNLTPGFNIDRKDICKPRRGSVEFWDLVRLILDILRYLAQRVCRGNKAWTDTSLVTGKNSVHRFGVRLYHTMDNSFHHDKI